MTFARVLICLAGMFLALPAEAESMLCARASLRDVASRHLTKMRTLANHEPVMARYFEDEIAPGFLGLIKRLPDGKDDCPSLKTSERATRECASDDCESVNLEATRAPEWGIYSDLLLRSRLKWQDAVVQLPSWRTARSNDDAAICRVRRSMASATDVLERFKTGCQAQPEMRACADKSVAAAYLKQRQELENRLELNYERYKEKWGVSALQKLACR